MRNLWLKIGFGAAGIFAVGMIGLTLARQARTAAANAIDGAFAEIPAAFRAAHAARAARAEPMAHLASLQDVERAARGDFVSIPFRLDGQEIGVIRSGSIRRVRTGALPGMDMEVELTSSDHAELLDDCVLVPEGRKQRDFGGGFRCATNSDRDLVTFGRVRFLPARNSRPIMLTSAQAADLRHGEPFEAKANLQGDVNVEATGDNGEQVRVVAGQGGANIQINDDLGRDIFRLIADSMGASLRVRDKNGRDIVRLVAGDGRLALSVDTAGH